MQIVFRAGEFGNKFFIILSGEVKVLIQSEIGNIKEVSRLEAGMAFGELALLKNQPRSASIKCSTPCHFMTLTKEHYLKIIGRVENIRLEEKVNLLHSVSIFSSWTKRALEKLSYFFKSSKFVRKQVVYREGDNADWIFVVKSGEFELSKNSDLVKRKRKSCLIEQKLMGKISNKVAILGTSEMFGDEEAIKDIFRIYTCTCISNGELFIISKYDFTTKIRSEEAFQFLFDTNSMRENLRNSRLSIIQNIEKTTESKKSHKSFQNNSFLAALDQIKSKKINPTKKKKFQYFTEKEIKRIEKTALTPKLRLHKRLPDFSPISLSPLSEKNTFLFNDHSMLFDKFPKKKCLTPVPRLPKNKFLKNLSNSKIM